MDDEIKKQNNFLKSMVKYFNNKLKMKINNFCYYLGF
jgi:hypothetical protein